ncbi:putative J domain-containing protein [Cotonvirus japonicus]|uniref:J domain-containing protein n=1 Tax=Cotonvirus japonicus TaxID=2811091 RepID=A0ABM7NSK5_9VIRU|nr:putative J domain-containing protein [Cotonvirus japonicus]BCS83096.1 putative J domain-containing protein [Cotonvirus japonicus]
MSVEYKQKNDVPDLYKILGLTSEICKEDNCDEKIRLAYNKRVKKYHPDKHPGKKEIEELFELIVMAYDILKDEKQREAYNHKMALEKQSTSDFFKLRKSTLDYAESVGEYKPPTDQQKLSFKQQMKSMDDKHGFDVSKIDKKLSEDKSKKKLTKLASTRAEQDRELMPEKIFDDNRFDLSKFNAVFDKYHNKDSTSSIMQHNGIPSAWNEPGGTMSFGSFDNLDNIYVEDRNRLDTSRQSYGDINFGKPTKRVTGSDIVGISGTDYTIGHNKLDDDYYRDMKAKLRERESQANLFDSMKYTDFKRDDTAGYGIFDQLGYKFDDRLCLDDDEGSITDKYEKLMAERNKEILPQDVTIKKSNKIKNKGR